jgi:hypothetical protein
MTTKPTGLDDALSLDAVYYSGPVPRDLATLTVLGTVFDRIYFPDVYLPLSGFNQVELDKEIARIIEATRGKPTRNPNLVGILRFVRHAKTLQGFCVFTGDGEVRLSSAPHQMVDGLYQAIHGPHPAGWTPMIENNFAKSMPGSDEAVLYPGDYHYMSGALLYSAKTGTLLLNDTPGLPVPLIGDGKEGDKAKYLSSLIAIECAKLALPELPLLRPEDLMEFRVENGTALRNFRRSLLRYAGMLDSKLGEVRHPEDIEEATRFFVQTEIAPALDELRAKMNAPARPWYKRAIDAIRVLPKVSPSFYTMDIKTIIGAALATYLPQFFTELSAIGEKREAIRKSNLYYLLRLEAFHTDNQP